MLGWKKCAIAAMMLSACIPYDKEMVYTTQPYDGPLVAIGRNETTEWKCYQEDTNQQTVFLECRFRNFSVQGDQNTCLRLYYYGNDLVEEIAHSRLICSGEMLEDTEVRRYVAFQKQPRKNLLAYCGMDNARCHLVIKEEPKPLNK